MVWGGCEGKFFLSIDVISISCAAIWGGSADRCCDGEPSPASGAEDGG